MLIRFKRQVLFTIILSLFTFGYSIDLLSNIQNMGEKNARGYALPFVSSFGTALNSGTYYSASTHKFLGFDITANLAYVPIPDGDMTFQFFIPTLEPIAFYNPFDGYNYNLQLNSDELYPSDRTASTIFGTNEEKTFSPNQDYVIEALEDQFLLSYAEAQILSENIMGEIPTFEMVGGFDFSTMGAVMPQISVGLPLDIDVMARMMPKTNIDKVGEVSMIGFGGKIGLNQFIPFNIGLLPRISFGYYMTNMDFGDVISMKNTMTNLQISKKLLFLTVYGGYGIESSSVDVEYTWDGGDLLGTVPIKFSMDGKNESRITAGVRMKLLFFSLQGEYNMGDYDAYNLGVSFTFR